MVNIRVDKPHLIIHKYSAFNTELSVVNFHLWIFLLFHQFLTQQVITVKLNATEHMFISCYKLVPSYKLWNLNEPILYVTDILFPVNAVNEIKSLYRRKLNCFGEFIIFLLIEMISDLFQIAFLFANSCCFQLK